MVKVELETYARESGNPIVKPFVLVVAQNTTHAADLLKRIRSDHFFEGRYRDKVLQVDSTTKEDEVVEIQPVPVSLTVGKAESLISAQ
jgi:type III restriction enzyme